MIIMMTTKTIANAKSMREPPRYNLGVMLPSGKESRNG